MPQSSPHPRNDQFYNSNNYTGSNPHYPAIVQPEPQQVKLPIEATTPDELEHAKTCLENSILGISCRDILRNLSQGEWTMRGVRNINNASLTKKLVQLSPTLSTRFETLATSESFLTKIQSYLPFFGRALESDLYLKSLVDVNNLIARMERDGLIHIHQRVVVIIGPHTSPLQSLMISTHSSSKIFISDLGHLALQA